MNIRNIDGTQLTLLKQNSHKKILFDCDGCGLPVEQSYRNYLKQNDGKFCRKCRNKHTSNRPDVKKKQSISTKERWLNDDYRSNVTKKVSEARKKEWRTGKRHVMNKTPYNVIQKSVSNDDYILVTTQEEYNKTNIIEVICPKKHTFTTNHTTWSQGHRCPYCKKADYNMIYNDFLSEEYILITKEDDYINNKQKLCYTCPKGTNHSISWSNWQLGHRCPCCNDGMSKAEKEIAQYIKELGFDIELKNRTLINPLELDIIIPSKNIAIEYNGLYFHGEKNGKKNKKYHLEKLDKCSQIGYRLITILEDEWITKSNIVKNRLKHILSNEKGIYARKCQIVEIPQGLAKRFVDQYHIQGYSNCAIKLGAYYGNELVAVMTFSKGNISKGSSTKLGVWELNRFCVSRPVIGIAGKLLKYFEVNYKPNEIFSFADRRWSDGNVYNKIGFTFVCYTQPNYWYFKDNKKRLHRFNFRKDKIKHLGTENQTEWEIMQEQGYDRIWDCGNIKFIKNV